jgi:hypothetical protein
MSVAPRLDRALLAEVFKDPRLISAFEQMFALLETTVAQAQAIVAANAAVAAAPVLLTSASDAFGAGSIIRAGTGVNVAAADGAVTVSLTGAVPLIDGGKSVRFIVTDDTTLLLPRTGTLATIAEVQAMTVGVLEGDKGDITVTGDGATWTIDADVISAFGRTLTAAADAAAARTVIGAAAASHTHIIADVTGLQAALDAKLDDSQATAFGLSLLDDADATAGRATLGLGTAATRNTGTSGTTVALLDGGNTWSALQTFTGSIRISATSPEIAMVDSDTSGVNALGYLILRDSANTVRMRIGKPFAGGAITFDNTDDGFDFTKGGTRKFFIDTASNRIDIASGIVVRINSVQVLGARKTGWATATGTATRTTFDTATVTLPQLAERMKALIDDLHGTAGHGIIGT